MMWFQKTKQPTVREANPGMIQAANLAANRALSQCDELSATIHEIDKQVLRLSSELTSLRNMKQADDPKGLIGRVEELELWRARMHAMLTEVSPATGKEKLSKAARILRNQYTPR